MKMKNVFAVLFAVSSLASASAFAAEGSVIDLRNLYVGGGLSINSVTNSDNGTGFQFFAGYDLPWKVQTIHFAAEAGYMDTGNMNETVNTPFGSYTASTRARGLWTTGVAFLPIAPQIELLARAGLDLGDDDGAMFGVGADYNLNRQMQLRAEYVARPNVDSIQGNFVFHLQ